MQCIHSLKCTGGNIIRFLQLLMLCLPLPLYNQVPQHYNSVAALPVSVQHSYSNSSSCLDSKENVANSLRVNILWLETIAGHNCSPMAIQSQPVAPQPLAIQQQVVQD
ncbi:hypothetical protein CRYUN_Cryun31cG0016800 [Craigia yunnanensis]